MPDPHNDPNTFALSSPSAAEPPRRPRDTSGAAVFKEFTLGRGQRELFAANVFDLLPDDHECFLFAELTQTLDVSQASTHYSPIGQRAYDPKQLIAILIYAYSRGVFSSRQIAQRCAEDLGFMYIAGSTCPSHRVLRDFRQRHGTLFFDCFKQTVKLAQEFNLASLSHVSLDGSKFKANSSKHKAMSYGRLKQQEAELSAEIEALLAQAARCDKEEDLQYQERTGYELSEDLKHKQNRIEKIQAAKAALEKREQQRAGESPEQVTIEDRKQISFADHDANLMGKKGNTDYGYNIQASVDSDFQIIVGQHITGMANDYAEVSPALEQLKANCDQYPDKLSMDNGYYSGDNLQALSDHQIDAYVATNREEKPHKEALEVGGRRLIKSDFSYDAETDQYTCPADQVLSRCGNKEKERRYRAAPADCGECPFKSQCLKTKKTASRTLNYSSKEPLRQRMNQHMAEAESRDVYDKRKVIVEPVFGQIKNGGFRGFMVRGQKPVEGECSLVCLVHNLKKIFKYGQFRPGFDFAYS